MGRVSVKGAVVGAITDIVMTNVALIPLSLYIAHSLKVTGMPPQRATHAVLAALKGDPLYYTLSLLLGGFCSILGGNVSAKIAKHDEILNGAMFSFLCVGSGVYAMVYESSSLPLSQHISFLFGSIFLAALGGFLRLRHS
jgi:hypothetical protein